MADYLILPLERILLKCCEDVEIRQMFPDHTRKYYQDYMMTLERLRREIYDNINVGLAVCSGDDVGIYTDHGAEHFDEVVRWAGILLGLSVDDASAVDRAFSQIKSREGWHLSPYEVFLLLHAIRFHDTGNIYGRKKHEKKILSVMKRIDNIGLEDMPERQIIASIGQAHGGKISEDDLDTIGKLSTVTQNNKCKYRSQFIAALVRLADEICEGRRRSTNVPKVPEGNEIYHEYARSIEQCNLDDGHLFIRYSIQKSNALKTFGKETKSAFLTDEIFLRLEKMELERKYCNMFLEPALHVRTLKASIVIWEDLETEEEGLIHHTVKSKEIQVSETGYPGSSLKLLEKNSDLSGESLRKEFH